MGNMNRHSFIQSTNREFTQSGNKARNNPITLTSINVDAQKNWPGFIGFLDIPGTSLITTKYLVYSCTYTDGPSSGSLLMEWDSKFSDIKHILVITNGGIDFEFSFNANNGVTVNIGNAWNSSHLFYSVVTVYIGINQVGEYAPTHNQQRSLAPQINGGRITIASNTQWSGFLHFSGGGGGTPTGPISGTISSTYDINQQTQDIVSLINSVDIETLGTRYSSINFSGPLGGFYQFSLDYSTTAVGSSATGFPFPSPVIYVGTTASVSVAYRRGDGIRQFTNGIAMTYGVLVNNAIGGPNFVIGVGFDDQNAWNPVSLVDYWATIVPPLDNSGESPDQGQIMSARKSRWRLGNGFSGIININKKLQPFINAGQGSGNANCTIVDFTSCGSITKRGALEVVFYPITNSVVPQKTTVKQLLPPPVQSYGATTVDLFSICFLLTSPAGKIGQAPDGSLDGIASSFTPTPSLATLAGTNPVVGCATG